MTYGFEIAPFVNLLGSCSHGELPCSLYRIIDIAFTFCVSHSHLSVLLPTKDQHPTFQSWRVDFSGPILYQHRSLFKYVFVYKTERTVHVYCTCAQYFNWVRMVSTYLLRCTFLLVRFRKCELTFAWRWETTFLPYNFNATDKHLHSIVLSKY
jgi:hypothetical protein